MQASLTASTPLMRAQINEIFAGLARALGFAEAFTETNARHAIGSEMCGSCVPKFLAVNGKAFSCRHLTITEAKGNIPPAQPSLRVQGPGRQTLRDEPGAFAAQAHRPASWELYSQR